MRLGARRLVQNPGRAKDRVRRGLVPCGVAEQPRLQRVRAKQPLHAGVRVHDQRAHEVPIPGIVELHDAAAGRCEAEAVESPPTRVLQRETAGVAREKQKIGVASRPVAPMAGVCAAKPAREVANRQRMATRKPSEDLACGGLDRRHQRGCAVPRVVGGPDPAEALPAIGEWNGLEKVATVERAERDRPAGRKRLGRTRAEREDRKPGEKPKHSKCMIAHGSA